MKQNNEIIISGNPVREKMVNFALLITLFFAVAGSVSWILGFFNIFERNLFRYFFIIIITLILGLIIYLKKEIKNE